MNFLRLAFTLFFFAGCANTNQVALQLASPTGITQPIKLIEIDHEYFRIGYYPDLRLAHYVIYQVTAEQLQTKKATRRNRFKADPYLVDKGIDYVKPNEYKGSPYHRGHLAPAADFGWSQEASDLSFVMSNMAPQTKNLNSDAWLRLETQVRKWGCGEGKITVITGPIFSDEMPQLASGLKIPQRFYKIVIDETPPRKLLSFVYGQDDRGNVLNQRLASIRDIESAVHTVRLNKLIAGLSGLKRMPASVEKWKEADCDSP